MNHLIPIVRQPHIQSPVAQLFFILSSPAKAFFNSYLEPRVLGQPNLGALVGCHDVSLHAHKIENYEWDGQARGGYCGSAIGLVELMRAFRGLSTNVTAAGQRVHFVRS
jgi:hypothetical protein